MVPRSRSAKNGHLKNGNQNGEEMQTFERICIKDYEIWENVSGDELRLKLENGKKYLTSAVRKGKVTVFTNVWAIVPVDVFGWKTEFTK